LPPPDSLFFEATLPFSVAERTWHEIGASVNELTIVLSINDELVANISIPPSSNPFIPSITPGGVGYTTSVDQQVIVRDLTVKEFTTDNVLYQDPLTSEEAVRDFGVGTNELPLILDGAKRDRNVWAGDLLVAGPALYYSNFDTQYAAGSIAICNSYQLATGQVSSRINVGFPLQPNVPSADFVTPIFYSYTYFLSNVIVAADYYLFTAHAQFVQEQFPILQRVMDSFAPMVDDTGLINAQSYVWGYDFVPGFGVFIGHVTKMNLLYAMALDASAAMADVVSNATLASEYRAQAASVRTAINTHLYNSTTNTYYVSDQSTSTMLQDVNAFAILAGAIQGDNASALLDTMKETLRLDDGYLVAYPPSAPFFPVISPFSSFFHAQAAFDTDRSDLAFDVIDQVWSQMVEKGDYYTGTFWEMRSVDEYPEPSTSMAHAWAAGPAVLLSKYVLGVQPTSPGYSTWLVRPQPEKLTWAAGAVNTPHGIMDIKWNATESLFSVWIDVPRHTSGTVSLPRSSECISVNNVAYSLGTHNKSGVGSVEANKDRVAVTLTTSGTYTIASHATCTPAASSPVAVTPQAVSSASHLAGALGLFALVAACLV
jgi:alpha-L-rhamnosidase